MPLFLGLQETQRFQNKRKALSHQKSKKEVFLTVF